MRFHRNVSMEKREYLTKELKDYEKKTEMSSEERCELHKWVAAGNSVRNNPNYIYDEDGYPMDFVEAYQADNALSEEMEAMNEAELDEILRRQEQEAIQPSFL